MSYGFNSDKSKFPLGAASDLPDPTKTPLKIIGELQNQIIDSASIENGATASKAYASGDYVCFQGALCKASKAISQGDTLSIGDTANDNLTLTDAAAEFARINSNLTTTYVNTGITALRVYRSANVVSLIYDAVPDSIVTGGVLLGTLPESIRPPFKVEVGGYMIRASEYRGVIFLEANPNGNLVLRAYTAYSNATEVHITLTYVVN